MKVCARALVLINVVNTSARSGTGRSERGRLSVAEEESDLRVLPEFGCNVAGSVECLDTLAPDSVSERLVNLFARHRGYSDLFIHQAGLESRELQLSRDFQTFGQSAVGGGLVTAGEFQPRPGSECREHEVDDPALGAEF